MNDNRERLVEIARQELDAKVFRILHKCNTEEDVHNTASALRKAIEKIDALHFSNNS